MHFQKHGLVSIYGKYGCEGNGKLVSDNRNIKMSPVHAVYVRVYVDGVYATKSQTLSCLMSSTLIFFAHFERSTLSKIHRQWAYQNPLAGP